MDREDFLASVAECTAELESSLHPIYCSLDCGKNARGRGTAAASAAVRRIHADRTDRHSFSKYIGKQNLFGTITSIVNSVSQGVMALSLPAATWQSVTSTRDEHIDDTASKFP